jgi:hypothetical protein
MPHFAWKLLCNIALHNLCIFLLGSHKIVVSWHSLLPGCEAMSCEWFLVFRGIVLPLSSRVSSPRTFFLNCLHLKTKAPRSFNVFGTTLWQDHVTEDSNGCQNLRVCTVVSVSYWSSMNCIFQFYRCLKSMYIVLLGVICVCVCWVTLCVVY